jgi:hypothetical protein
MVSPEVVQGHTMSQEQFSKYRPCSCHAIGHPLRSTPCSAASIFYPPRLVNDELEHADLAANRCARRRTDR